MLYGSVTGGKILMTNAWPQTELPLAKDEEKMMNIIFDIVRTLRNIRAESRVPAWERRNICIVCPDIYTDGIVQSGRIITGLSRGDTLQIGKKPEKGSGYSYGVIHGIDLYVDTRIDSSKIEEEKERLLEQIEEKKEYLRNLSAKLQNNAFIANAPEKIVRTEMEKKYQVEWELKKIEEKYQALSDE